MEAIVVNLGGVIVPHLSQTILTRVEDLQGITIKPSQRQLLRSCVSGFQLGHSDLSQLVEQSGLGTLGIADFQELVPKEIKVNHEVTGILSKLTRSLQVYIIGDYPPLWLPVLEQDPEWSSLSTRTQWLDIGAAGIESLIPGVIDFMLMKTGRTKEKVLFIDARADLTSACIRAELNAILYVSGFRLEQELRLRNIL